MTSFSAIKAGEGFFSLSLGGPFASQLKGFQRSLRGMGRIGGGFKELGSGLTGIGTKLAGVSAAMGGLIARGVTLAAQNERTATSFTVLLKSAEKARDLMAELEVFAKSTPFRLPEIQDAARKMIAFGFSQEEVLPLLRQFGDIASGTGTSLSELAEIMGKNRVQGRLFAIDLNQLSNRGIDVRTKLMEAFGTTGEGLRELVKEGKVGFADLQKAMAALAAEDFAGLTQKQSQATLGLLSTFLDNLDAISRKMGEAFLPAINEGLQALTKLVGPMLDWAKLNRQAFLDLGMLTLKIGAAAAGFLAAGAVFTQVGGVIAAFAALAGGAVAVLAGPAGPIAIVAAALVGLAASMPGVRAAFIDAFAAISSTVHASLGAVAQAIKEGNIPDAMTIMAEGMKLVWNDALRGMEEAWLEFQRGILQGLLDAKLGGLAGKQVQKALLGLSLESVRVGTEGATERREFEALIEELKNKREEERIAKATEEMARLMAFTRTGLPVI